MAHSDKSNDQNEWVEVAHLKAQAMSQPSHASFPAAPPARLSAASPLDEDQMEEEQLRMAWLHARLAIFMAAVFAMILAVALRGKIASPLLMDIWLVARVGTSLFRIGQGWVFIRQAHHGPGWTRGTLLALAVDGAIWGLAGLYVVLTAPWPLASFFSAVLACIACVATFGLQVSTRFTGSYVLPILAPTALGLFLRGELYGHLGGFGMLMLLGLQLATAIRTEQRARESLVLRLQAEALAQDKAEALKIATRQSAVRTQFLANISHELRTPLHGILGISRLLRTALSKEPALTRRVELIESSGTHLLSLINDLLDLSRIDAGQFLIRPERHDLAAQVEQVASIYAARCEDKGLRFILADHLPTPCWVMVDPARFRQVLHNLLGNAVKFTQEGSVTFTITRDTTTGIVRAEVRDTGPGIAQHDLSKVFEAFKQSDSSAMVQSTEGAGLGLTIARDIARAMKGDVMAYSAPGEGATLVFTAHMPATEAPAPVTTPSGAMAQTPHDVSGMSRHCLALLAEDNDINALVAMNFLEIIGVDTERVKDGSEAVREGLRSPQRPDIILMDCQMPVMNGHDATREIRSKEHAMGLNRVPIVALTATASDRERQDCLDAGMDDFLAKPCSLEDLSRVIAHWTGPGAITLTPAGAAAAPQREAETVNGHQPATGKPGPA